MHFDAGERSSIYDLFYGSDDDEPTFTAVQNGEVKVQSSTMEAALNEYFALLTSEEYGEQFDDNTTYGFLLGVNNSTISRGTPTEYTIAKGDGTVIFKASFTPTE